MVKFVDMMSHDMILFGATGTWKVFCLFGLFHLNTHTIKLIKQYII